MNLPIRGFHPAGAYAFVSDMERDDSPELFDSLARAGYTIGALLEEEWAVNRYNRFRELDIRKTCVLSILRTELDWNYVEQIERWIEVFRLDRLDVIELVHRGNLAG
jgi:hypothetical protein